MNEDALAHNGKMTLGSLPAHARVWVYKSPRVLSGSEIRSIVEKGQAFTSTWAAHGAALKAAVEVLHDRFIMIAVDEQQAEASGCSIDKSVAFIQAMEKDLNVSLTNRMLLWYEGNGEMKSCNVNEIEALISSNVLSGETIVYNDLVSTISDLNTRFRVPIKDSWLSRYL